MTSTEATRLRLALGLSKYKVAKALGCSWAHYHLYEKGERQLSAAKLGSLQAILTEHPQAQTK